MYSDVDTEPMAWATGMSMPQYSRWQVLAVWAAAALPMALVSWVAAPFFAAREGGELGLAKWLIGGLTLGLVWQGLLVMVLVLAERRNLRWTTLKDALWLHAPTDPSNGRKGGRLWLVCLPLIAGLWLVGALPEPSHDESRNFAVFLGSATGQAFFAGNWSWYGIVVVMVVFNTVLGEELLFRGFLLPRMSRAFGRADWLVNGVLFALYHVHTPWVIPAAVLDALWFAGPTKYYRSAWIGIVVHSTASVVILVLLFPIVSGAAVGTAVVSLTSSKPQVRKMMSPRSRVSTKSRSHEVAQPRHLQRFPLIDSVHRATAHPLMSTRGDSNPTCVGL